MSSEGIKIIKILKLSRDLPTKIDVFEYLLPKLDLMILEPKSQDEMNEPEMRFIDFLTSLSINSEDITELIYTVKGWIIKVDKEKALMVKRADRFLELYATNFNHYFSATKDYQKQAKKALSLMERIFIEFTNTGLREKYKHYDKEWKRKAHSLFDSSPLNSNQVQTSMFGLDTYETPVQLLFAKLQMLFLKLEDLFNYALNIDNAVENLRKDHGRILEIFNKSKQKTDEELKYIIEALDLKTLEGIFPELVSDLRTMNFEDFIVKYYHELNVAEFNYLMPMYRMVLKETYGINREESDLYDEVTNINEKINHVEKLRILMEHLEEFDTKGNKVQRQQKYHVSSKFIAMLAEELAIPYKKQKAFVDYFTRHYHGDYVPVDYGAVNKCKIDKKSELYKKFKSTADTLMEKHKGTNNLEGKKKVAVNSNINHHTSILASLLA